MILRQIGLLAPLLLAPIAGHAAAEPAANATQKRQRHALVKARPDLLILKDGKEIECRVAMEGRETILVRIGKGSKTREYARTEVAEIQTIINETADSPAQITGVERHAFYVEARKTYCIVQTAETRFYGNLILQKGVVPPS